MTKTINLISMLKGGVITALMIFTLGYSDISSAAGGCGLGYHRGPYGGCRANVGAVGPRGCLPGYHRGVFGACRHN